MGYIKKNVNIFLLLLLIISLGVMASLTTYYQFTYKNLSMSYGDKLNQLNQLNYNLTDQKAQLKELNDELAVKSDVNQKFDVLYTNISDYNSKLTSDLDSTRADLINTLQKLKQSEADLETAKSQLDSTKAALKTQTQYSADLEAEVAQQRSQICDLKQQINQSC